MHKNSILEQRPIRVFIIVLFLSFLLFAVEAGTMFFVFSLPYLGITEKNNLFLRYKKALHPLLNGKPLPIRPPDWMELITKKGKWQELDPWFGFRNNILLKKGVYATDKLGFICNGDVSRDISSKAVETYRIFVLGGSTVAGYGVSSPQKSITAHLERMLNSSDAFGENKPSFQVINTGVIGWYSAQEVGLTEFELLYYRPDMIITLDGVNDMINSNKVSPNNKIKGKESYYLHQHQIKAKRLMRREKARHMKKFKNALNHSKYNLLRYFYSTHLICYELPRLLSLKRKKYIIRNELKKIPSKYSGIFSKSNPYYRGRFVHLFYDALKNDTITDINYINTAPANMNTLFVGRYINNLKNLRAICDVNNIQYAAILQPTLLKKFKAEHSSREEFLLNYCITQAFFHEYKRNYILSTENYYEKSVELGERELGDKFFDWSKMFYSVKEELYSSDWWHYNEKANKLIASKMKVLIESMIENKKDGTYYSKTPIKLATEGR